MPPSLHQVHQYRLAGSALVQGKSGFRDTWLEIQVTMTLAYHMGRIEIF